MESNNEIYEIYNEIYSIIFNNQPLSCEEISGKMKDPPEYEQLRVILWFRIPGIRVYKKEGTSETYFTSNRFSKKEQYDDLRERYKKK